MSKNIIRKYKVSKHNSTVCGYPGRNYDWNLFDWEQKTEYDFSDMRYSKDSEYVPKELKGQLLGIKKAPKVFVDNCSFFIENDCQYLHVPYKWSEQATVYRVRANESMRAGEIYRGTKVIRQSAIKENGIWYWVLECEQ